MQLNQSQSSISNNSSTTEQTEQVIDNIKDYFTCWICLEPVDKPFFCPNTSCMKGAHRECIYKAGEDIKCVCGNIYNKEKWKSIQHIEALSKYALNANKILKELELKKCLIHKNEVLKHYCYECNKVYCGTCLIMSEKNKHNNHRIMNYDNYKIIEESKTSNIKLIHKTIEKIDNIYYKYISLENNILMILKDWVKDIEDNDIKIRTQINEYKRQLENSLNIIGYNYNEWINNLNKNEYNELSDINEIKNKIKGSFSFEKDILIKEVKEIQKLLEVKNEDIDQKIKKLLNLKRIKYDVKIYNDDIFKGKYEGEFVNDKREGKGIFYWENGEKYTGEWKNDIREGKGIQFYNNGQNYDGEWKNDKREGRGILYYNNRIDEYDNYDGEWQNDKSEGKGILYYNNGDKYDGEWKNNGSSGIGIF